MNVLGGNRPMSRVFISYRRQDASDATGRIYDRLVTRFGKEQVFKDVDNIPYGTDFRNEMGRAVGQSVVVLVVIGEHWLSVTDQNGRRRIENLDDFVRIEVEAALKRDVRVIPLLVGGARMPSQAELPEAIQALAFRNAVQIRNDPDFHRDMDRLIESIGETVDRGGRTDEAARATPATPDSATPIPPSAPARLMRVSVREIEEQMQRRMCGQDFAVAAIMPFIKLMRFGMFRDNRPAATFLFVGPSGVGKTLMARELARVICGDEDRLYLFEMAHYRDPSSTQLLVGAPPGYVGYGEGRLVNALRDAPECVLLFDEIDKADSHPVASLMRLMDSGSIQDASGPVRDARRAVLILAVNADADTATTLEHRDDRDGLTRVMREEAKKRLGAEIVNRVDEVVCFLPFSKSACREITDTAIQREILRLKEAQGIDLVVDESVQALVARVFYDASLSEGARAAPRTVHRVVTSRAIDFLVECESEESSGMPRSLLATASDGEKVVISRVPSDQ
jgi:ATP-dependent Clp protease ATP-binding subunit ClpA